MSQVSSVASPLASIEPVFISVRELSRRTGLSKVFLDERRVKGGGPPFYRVGKRCLYRWDECLAWFDTRREGAVS